jgi:hypothetical protein
MKKNKVISDWLDKYNDPEIDKKVEMKLEEMNKERYNQIINEAYENFEKQCIPGTGKKMSKEEFINICKINPEFSEKWGLKIEERELSLEERKQIVKNKYFIEFYWKIVDEHNNENTIWEMNKRNIPTKLITITYNNETIEVYE